MIRFICAKILPNIKQHEKEWSYWVSDDIYSHGVPGFRAIFRSLDIHVLDINHRSIGHDYILEGKMQVIDVNFQWESFKYNNAFRAQQTKWSGQNSCPISAEMALPRLQSEIKVALFLFATIFILFTAYFSNSCLKGDLLIQILTVFWYNAIRALWLQYFSHMYIVVVSFICGGNLSIRRNTPTWLHR